MSLIFLFLSVNIIYSVIDTIAMSLAMYYFNVAIKKIRFFSIFHTTVFHLGEVPVSFGIIPIGGCVEFYLPQEYRDAYRENERDSTQSSLAQKRLFDNLHPLKRVIISLSGSLIVLIIAAIFLGPTQAVISIIKGFEQIFQGSLSSEYARDLFKATESSFSSQTIFVTISILLTKFVSWNLFPLPAFHGGFIVQDLLSLLVGRKIEFPQFLMVDSLLIALGLSFRWIILLMSYAFS